VWQPHKDAAAHIFERLSASLPDFAEEERLQPGETLAVICGQLGEAPVRFPATSRPAKAEISRPVIQVTVPGQSTGLELPGLEDDAGPDEVLELLPGNARVVGGLDISLRK
jgi:hypothetical protein